jgi:murein L,D-transpeptidase YcbB/YkuD
MAKIESGKTQQFLLNNPIDVYIAYFTAWVDNDGNLQVRPDIYGSDLILDTALRGWKDFRAAVPPE